MRPLAEQVIVVTGGSSGIGRATALAAAARGAKVAIAARGADALEATRREIEGTGGEVLAVPTDVAEFSQVEALGRETVGRFGRIDTWVNAAAVSVYGEFDRVEPDEFRRVIEVDVLGTAHGARVALAQMKRQPEGGTIVNISSGLGDRAVPLQSAYSAAKAAVTGFGEALRVELARAGSPIRVATIKPASIDTPFFRHARSKMDAAPAPVPPVYDPDLVAGAILHAATHPVRELSVGGASAALTTLEKIAPAALDWGLKLVGYAAQRADHSASATGPDNLFAGSTGPGSVRGEWGGRSFSLYTALATRFPLKPLVWASLALAGIAAARSRRG
jgi:NAD(P)-dependent dehydrogenase (short-subunit alcohol dehydrogenase family)